MTEKVPVIMCDHKVDDVDAEQHYKESIGDFKIGRIRSYLAKDQVFPDPDHRQHCYQNVKKCPPRPEQSPDCELPGDKKPFDQGIEVIGYGVVETRAPDKDKADHFVQRRDD